MTETWDDVNEHVKTEWKDDTTPFERVYEIIEHTHKGQSAAEIANRALVSEPTARRHCKTLVNTGFAETDRTGKQPCTNATATGFSCPGSANSARKRTERSYSMASNG